jgi:hypothetical protein
VADQSEQPAFRFAGGAVYELPGKGSRSSRMAGL